MFARFFCHKYPSPTDNKHHTETIIIFGLVMRIGKLERSMEEDSDRRFMTVICHSMEGCQHTN